MRSKNGFTLIELLVVIAIIALLLAVLVPSLQTAKQMAQGTVCMAHLRGLSMGFYLYAEDNNSRVAISSQGYDDQGSRRWVGRPQDIYGTETNDNSTVEDKEHGIRAGSMFPYVETVKAYHCAGDKRFRLNVNSGKGAYRSFSMPETIGTVDNSGDPIEFTVNSVSGASFNITSIIKYSDFRTPGSKYVFIEENYTHGSGTSTTGPPNRGFNLNVWSFWRDDRYESWHDPLAPWHNDRTNLGYVDGHAEKLVWKDKRTVWFAHDRLDPRLGGGNLSACALQVGNPDQEYMSRAYPRAR